MHRQHRRTPLRLAILVEETGQHINRFADWQAAFEVHKYHVIARSRFAVPRPVPRNERAAGKRSAKLGLVSES